MEPIVGSLTKTLPGISSMPSTRLIMYHKQSTSARTRFLKLGHGGVCAFDPLPPMSQVLERDEVPRDRVARHPAVLISQTEQSLGLHQGGLALEPGYRVRVDVPGETIEVFLARFTDIDPPFGLAEANGASFIDLTQARGMAPVELQLLRLAYEMILG